MNADQYPQFLAAAINEGLTLGVPPAQIAAQLDVMKLELQLKMLQSPRPESSVIVPANGRLS